MSDPRQVLKGQTYFLTRRTVAQFFLFRPDQDLNDLIFYALAYTIQQFNMTLQAICVMSNHIHMVITDIDGCHPLFTHLFHSLVAGAVKRLRTKDGKPWSGEVFDKRQTSMVLLATPNAIIEKIAYTLANPVAAGLVEKSSQWPGVATLVEQMGRTVLRVRRPDRFFNPKKTKYPEFIDLPIKLPPMVPEEQAKGFRENVKAELRRQETAARREILRQGRSFLGAAQVMQISPFDRPENHEPQGQLNPTFAVGREQPEARKAAIAKRRGFRTHYRIARDQWRNGNRGAIFPEGTWWMRVFYGVRTTADPDPPPGPEPNTAEAV